MPQEPIEPTPAAEESNEASATEPERVHESHPAASKGSFPETHRAEKAVEPLLPEIMKERAGESATSAVQGTSSSAPSPTGLAIDDLLKKPGRIRTLGPDEQVNIILDLVVQKKFPAAHDFIEQLGKKEDLAFYAWLEDSLHDAATREDWRKFIETQQ